VIRPAAVARAIVLGLVIAACGGGKPIAAPSQPAKVAAKPAEVSANARAMAEAIAHAYQLLTVESAVPGDPKVLRDAAIDALAPSGWQGPEIKWSDDPAHDTDALRGAVIALALRDQLPADGVLRAVRAMTLATNDTNTFALSKTALQALFGIMDGTPVVQPGMLYHKLDDERWAVSDVIAGSPAHAAGVQRGDVIVSLDGTVVTHGYMDFAALLGAPAAYEAMLVVERGGEKKGLVLRMTPVAQPILDVKILPGAIGYLRLWACTKSDDASRDASKLLATALAEFDKKKVKKLVLDLRGDAGGFPFDVASLLADADPLMIAISTGGSAQPVSRTKLAPWKIRRPIVVIVNELTASGAEMVALAIRDHSKAKLVGRPTAGALTFPTTEKLSGEVTLSYPLSRVGSAKTKAVLDGNRLAPDVAVHNPTAEDYAAGRDPQLDAALAMLKAMR
jgi:C-terminal processing protease CtpA/Prc